MTPTSGLATYPDYGNVGTNQAQPDIDNTELAARLGAVNASFRSGRVIFMDRGISLSPWSVAIHALPIYSPMGIQLTTVSGISRIQHILPLLNYTTLGISCDNWLGYIPISSTCTFSQLLTVFTGAYSYVYGAVLDLSTGNISVINNLGNYVVVGNYFINSQIYSATFKYTIDIINNTYKNLYLNNLSIDISSQSPQAFSQLPPYLSSAKLEYQINGSPAGIQWYISNFTVTSDEP